MKQYFKGKDSLGFKPQMTYQGKNSHGTFVGGCCSTVATVLMVAYFSSAIYQFLFEPYIYRNASMQLYQPIINPETYIMDTNAVIPMFQIVNTWYSDWPKDRHQNLNNQTLFNVQF